MQIKWISLVSVLIVGFSIGWIASVARYGIDIKLPLLGPPPGGPPPLNASIMREAKLSEEQIEIILSIQDSGKKKIEERIAQLERTKEAFEKLVTETQDQDALKKLFHNLMDAKRLVDEAHFEVGMQIQTKLTLEQNKALREQMMKSGIPFRPTPTGP
jgi:hypothetical protein